MQFAVVMVLYITTTLDECQASSLKIIRDPEGTRGLEARKGGAPGPACLTSLRCGDGRRGLDARPKRCSAGGGRKSVGGAVRDASTAGPWGDGRDLGTARGVGDRLQARQDARGRVQARKGVRRRDAARKECAYSLSRWLLRTTAS